MNHRLVFLVGLALFAHVRHGAGVVARGEAVPVRAKYHVKILQLTPPRIGVTATLPINGSALKMETTRPGDVPEVGEKGWPALVRNLRISDETGRPIEVASVSKAGWEMKQAHEGWLTLEYEVDYSTLAAHGWPAPREAAFADSTHFTFIGRSLFIMTPEVGSSTVTFSPPHAWRAVTPWIPSGSSEKEFTIDSAKDLAVNLIVLTQANPDVVTAGGFSVFITPMGHWQPASPEVKRVLQEVIPRFVALLDFKESANYSVILLPLLELGGESFRNSFALTMDAPPSKTDRNFWGRIIAHEIFHYWNGLRLRGADYASSQWFQEGFTDYAADLAMVASGLVSPDDFRQRLAEHVRNYQNLTTPLDAPGNQKGPPLYSGGALVAFCWDVQIRNAAGSKRNIGDFLKALWHQTKGGQREYAWSDIRAALESTADLDGDAFSRAYINGTEKLPLDEAFRLAGLRLIRSADGSSSVEPDPLASAAAKSLWRTLVEGR